MTQPTYRKRQPPRIIEVLDQRCLHAYTWQRPRDNVEVEVWRHIGLGVQNEGDTPKAYWYIVETQHHDDCPRTLRYGFFRCPKWD